MDRRRFRTREEYLNLVRLGRFRQKQKELYDQQQDFEFMTEFCNSKTFKAAKYLAAFSFLLGVLLLSTYYAASDWKRVKITDSNYSIHNLRRGKIRVDYWVELQGQKIEVTREAFNRLKMADSTLALFTPVFHDVKLIQSIEEGTIYTEKPSGIYSFIVSMLFIPGIVLFLPRSGILFATINYFGMALSIIIPLYILLAG